MSEKEYKKKCEIMFDKNAILINENEQLKAEIASLEESLDIEHDLGKDAAGEIELLQRENAELKEQIEKLKNNYKKQRNKRIDELQKENAELKKNKEYCKGYEDGYNAGKEDLQMLQTEIDRLKKNGKTN